jgi:signal transduction histidine kinase
MSATHVTPVELLVQQLEHSRPGYEELVQGLCERALDLTSVTRLMLLVNDGDGSVSISHSVGFQAPLPSGAAASLGGVAMAMAMLVEKARVVYMTDARSMGIHPTLVDALELSSVAVAAIAGQRASGLLMVDCASQPLLLGEHEIEQLAAISVTIGLAMQMQCHAAATASRWRLELARQIHDEVVQRLFGVSMALAANGAWSDSDRSRCQMELARGLADLRALLDTSPGEESSSMKQPDLRDELENLAVRHPDLPLQVLASSELPGLNPDLGQMVRHFLDEALRNVRKHANPTWVRVSVIVEEQEITVTVHNDGLRNEPSARGVGLRLLEAETMLVGGRVNHGRPSSECWRVSLTVPTEAR